MTRPDPLPKINPSPCRPGDRIGIAAPASPFKSEFFEPGVAVLRAMGFEPVMDPAIHSRNGHLAGSDTERVGVLHRYFEDADIRGVVCARGGFGAMRLLDMLDWALIRRCPKPLIGFSDITALLNAMSQKAGVVCYHGPVLTTLPDADSVTRDRFVDALTGAQTASFSGGTCLAPGRAEGPVQGGNLATLAALVGTPFMPDLRGCILILEEVNEPLRRIDRMMTQMMMAGCFEGIAGVALGRFSECGTTDAVYRFVADRLASAAVPILADLTIGHDGANWTIPIGAPAILDGAAGTLTPVAL